MSQAVAASDARRVGLVEDGSPRNVAVNLSRMADDFRARLQQQRLFFEAVVAELEEGVDYGELPSEDDSTSKSKKSNDAKKKPPRKMLFKPGADRITVALSAQPRFTIVEQEVDHYREVAWEKRNKVWSDGPNGRRRFDWKTETGTAKGFYRFVVRCEIVSHRDGLVLGEAIATCSSLEGKYCNRPREVENTLVQMASKRAHSAAVLRATGLSGRFSTEGEPETEHVDDDGVVEDPTDGLTLAQALEHKINNVALGTMRPKALDRTTSWCEGKLKESPGDPVLVRIQAMIGMVRTFRETNPLPPKEAPAETNPGAAAAPADASNADVQSSSDSDDDDPDKLPF